MRLELPDPLYAEREVLRLKLERISRNPAIGRRLEWEEQQWNAAKWRQRPPQPLQR